MIECNCFKNLIVSFATIIVFSFSSYTNDISDDLIISKTLDFNVFTLKTPEEWARFDQQGIDTFIGGLTNNVDTLYFDYGKLSFLSLDDITANSETISFENRTINGYNSKIVKEKRIDEAKIRYSLYRQGRW